MKLPAIVLVIVSSAACLFGADTPFSKSTENNTLSKSIWPRLLKLSFRPGIDEEMMRTTLAPYGVGDLSGDLTLVSSSNLLEIVTTSGEIKSNPWIIVAVPTGEEGIWQQRFAGTQNVLRSERVNNRIFRSGSSNLPNDAVLPWDVDGPQAISLPKLAGRRTDDILAEIESFLVNRELSRYNALPDPKLRGAGCRRVVYVFDGRKVFQDLYWQRLKYDVVTVVNEGVPSFELTIRASVAQGAGETPPPENSYGKLDDSERGLLGKYKLGLEERIRQHLESSLRSP